MAERVLCDEGIHVSMDGGGERTLIALRNGASMRFWADTAAVEEALRGEPVQISAYGGYCAIEVEGDVARLDFGLDGHGRKSCELPEARAGRRAGVVRTLPTPTADPPDPLAHEG